MAQQAGSNTQILLDGETTFKSDPGAVDAQVIPFKSESLRLTRNIFSSEAITASRNPQAPGRGNFEVSGALELEINPFMNFIFENALGTCVQTGADPYTHTIKIGALPAGMVIDKAFPDLAVAKYFKYNGCKVNSMNLTFQPDGILSMSVNILGAKETVGASALDAAPTDLGHTPFDGFEAAIVEGAEGATAAIAYVQEVTMVLENNLDGSVYALGGAGERRALPEGVAKVSGTVKALFESSALYDKAVANTETGIQITLTKGDGLGSAGNESIVFLLSEILFQQNAPVIPGPGGVSVELPFEAYYNDNTPTTAFQIVVKNSWDTDTWQ